MILWIALVAGGTARASELTGTVIAARDGVPVADALVVAYDQRLNYATEITDASGHFSFTSLPDNPYRIRVVPPLDVNLAEEWSDGTLHVCDASRYDTSAASLPPVRVALEPGAVLSGVLLDETGAPVVTAQVTARTARSTALAQSRLTFTDETGAFAVAGIPADDGATGTFVLEVLADGWPKQYLPSSYRLDGGEAHTLAPEDEIALGEIAVLPGIGVGGSVTGPDGPVADGQVHVFSPSQVADGDIVDGWYEVWGLPPGEVLSWASADGLATTYYPDTDRPGDRVPVLQEGELAADVDLLLPAEAVLRGQLLGTGDPTGASVLAYNSDRTVGVGATVQQDGSFEIGSLHGGCYTLYVHATDEGFTSAFALDEQGAERQLCVAEASISEPYEIALVRGARVSGSVVDRVDGRPVYGARISAVGQHTGGTEVVYTDRSGHYEIRGLFADVYEVSATYDHYCVDDPDWAALYYPQAINPVLAGVLELTAGQLATWDVSLPPDHDHDDMDDGWETEHGLDPTRDDSEEDPDGDGFSNGEEYLLGTDPRDAGAVDGRCGCSGDRAGLYGILCFPLWTARRRRVYARAVRNTLDGGATCACR